ncbi:MAG TPA: ribonuclease P protein component [Rhodocyclaceae bacterium]
MAKDHGFGSCLRLRQAGEFDAVFAHRRVLRGAVFDLHYRPNGSASARIGFVVAKKLARRAVWRNALKRVGRDSFRLARSGLPAMDLLLRLAKPVAADNVESRKVWRADIGSLFRRLPR